MQDNCLSCSTAFEVTVEDRKLLQKLSPTIAGIFYELPLPRLCHDCRSQRRMAFRNENKFYVRKCDFSGEECVSLYHKDSPYTVYKDDIWWSDNWDANEYSQDLNLQDSLFTQLDTLFHRVPRKSMQQNGVVENCEYTSYTSASKNCYILSSSGYCEDVYYSNRMVIAKNCSDCTSCVSSELLYECMDSTNCYNSMYLQNCAHCQDSYFLENCRNVHHSIACKNLRSKGYHIFNTPVSKQEFLDLEKQLQSEGFESMQEEFKNFGYTIPTLYAYQNNAENCSGNMLENTHNCHNCFSIILGADTLRHCQFCGWKGKDMMDCLGAGKDSELLYEATAVVMSQKISFSCNIESSSNIIYCEGLRNCHNCFACVGMTNANYCILNKQYTQHEYEQLIPKIISHMSKSGEWGENMPISISPFSYNETIAQYSYPLNKKEANQNSYKWHDIKKSKFDVEKTIPAEQIPHDITNIPDDILNWALVCRESKKPYIITVQELSFYRKMNIAIPQLHPDQRYIQRENRRLPIKLWQRECHKCNNNIDTCYAPDTPYIVYCESCFQHDMYHSDDEVITGNQAHGLNYKTMYKLKSSYRQYTNIAGAVKTTLVNKWKK